MFDTIKTYLSKDQLGINNLIDYCEPYISDITMIDNNYYQCMTGLLSSGQKVIISDNSVSFQGSITKYYNNTNLIDLKPIEISYAIEKLSDELHLPIEKSKVTKLHIGLNIETNYSADVYFPALGNKPRFERHKQNSSIYYSNLMNALTIYDKIRECKSHKFSIPIDYKMKHITRTELRLKSLSKYFKMNSVFLSDLTNRDFQTNAINALIKEYESIHKINISDMNIKEIKTPNHFIQFCASQYILSQGPESIKALTKQLKQRKAFKNKESYSRLNSNINKLSTNKNHNNDTILINEINSKLTEKASIYRL